MAAGVLALALLTPVAYAGAVWLRPVAYGLAGLHIANGLLHVAGSAVARRSVPGVSIGGFDGWGGMIYALAHLGALWHEPELLIKAEAIAQLLPPWIEQDDHFGEPHCGARPREGIPVWHAVGR